LTLSRVGKALGVPTPELAPGYAIWGTEAQLEYERAAKLADGTSLKYSRERGGWVAYAGR
jgi:hypothetical protein